MKSKKILILCFVMILFAFNSGSVYAQTITITITLTSRTANTGHGILEYSPIGLSQEIYFDPRTPLTTGTYTGEVSRMDSRNRDGIIIYGNGLSASRGIFIHYGQYNNDWSQGCIILEVNGFNAMYRHLRNSVGMNGRVTIVIRDLS